MASRAPVRHVLVAASAAVAGWAAGALNASCGSAARPDPAVPGRPSPAGRAVTGADVTGAWQWSLATDADGVRRVERERWELRASGRALSGFYDRRVTFLSVDGAPFACNHELSYELRTRYRLAGELAPPGPDGGPALTLRETGHDTAPSPCEPGDRQLTAYTGTVAGGALVLAWPGGSQTLRPAASAGGAAPSAHDDDARGDDAGGDDARASAGAAGDDAASVTGVWTWQGRSERAGTTEVRVEREAWTLVQTPAGALDPPGLGGEEARASGADWDLTGRIERTVTVFDEDGAYYACSGDTRYEYRDRYAVRGTRAGDRLAIYEVEVDAEEHPCLGHRDRHLDAATGRRIGDYLELSWRGGRRQVLRLRAP